jgi:hypothetical protein
MLPASVPSLKRATCPSTCAGKPANEKLVPVGQARGWLRIGNDGRALRSECANEDAHRGWYDVVSVSDQFTDGVVDLDERPDRAGGTVQERRHGVETVRHQTGTSLEGTPGLLIGGVRVPERDRHPMRDEQVHEFLGTRQFRGQCHDAEEAAAHGEEAGEFGAVGCAEPGGVMSATPLRVEVRALEVDAEWLRTPACEGHGCGRGGQLAFGQAVGYPDHVDEEGSRTSPRDPGRIGDDFLRFRRVQGESATAMRVEVDETGNDQETGRVDDRTRSGGSGSDRRDGGVADDEPGCWVSDSGVDQCGSGQDEAHAAILIASA